MKAITLVPRKGRWPKSQKWKITSIRIPWPDVAQGIEKRSIASGLRSPTDAIIQVLAGFIAGTPAPRKKIKLKWSLKPDVSARKQYATKAKAKKAAKTARKAKSAKPEPLAKSLKKAVRKVKTVAKRAATAIADPKRAAKNKADRERRQKIKAAAEAANGTVAEATAPAAPGDEVRDSSNSDESGAGAAGLPDPKAQDVQGLTA